MTDVELQFDDCKSCIRFKLNKARTAQKLSEACKECTSGEFYEPKRADTVFMLSRNNVSRSQRY